MAHCFSISLLRPPASQSLPPIARERRSPRPSTAAAATATAAAGTRRSQIHAPASLVNFSSRDLFTMARLYVGNLDPRVTSGELEDEFRVFGVLRSVWVARKPPGFAFIDFDDKRDAEDALRDLDEATALVIGLQDAVVFHLLVGAATAGHHVAEVILLMLTGEMVVPGCGSN
uniref:RRM domain-containing protein n=1 Tax=Leersia perrieri TaxID=77586 RepID=A0A0D9VM06_9ORYZ